MMPRLRPDLEANFVTYEVGSDGHVYHRYVDTLAEAHGIFFLCPKCYAENKGPIGTHQVGCWFVGRVPPEATPGPGRWNPRGTGYDDLTFVPPGAYSVQLTSGCMWHGFVINGGGA